MDDLSAEIVQGRDVDIRGDDGRAFAQEPLRRRPADAARGTGDEDDLAGEAVLGHAHQNLAVTSAPKVRGMPRLR